jgi:putative membrane protein
MMKRLYAAMFATALTAAVAAPSAFAADDSKEFIEKAVRGNIAEVKLGELAEKQAKSDQVKTLGETLRTDHGKALEKSKALAKEMDVEVKMEPTDDAKETYDELAKLSGAEFDREFVEAAVEDHEKDIELYTEQAEEGDNPKVVEYAKETLPVLKKHLDAARKLEGNVGN